MNHINFRFFHGSVYERNATVILIEADVLGYFEAIFQ